MGEKNNSTPHQTGFSEIMSSDILITGSLGDSHKRTQFERSVVADTRRPLFANSGVRVFTSCGTVYIRALYLN